MTSIGPSSGIETPSYISGPGVPPFPPLIGATAPSVYADFAVGNYWAAGVVQASFAAFMTATGGTFTNSTGKYVTNASGQLTQLAANTAPFNYRWNGTLFVPAGVLLEGASTNVHPQSSISSSIAAFSTPQITLTANAAVAPDGTSTAASLVPTAVANSHALFLTNGVTLTATPWTWSFYAKSFGPNNYFIQSDLDNTATVMANFDVLNGTVSGIVGGTASIVPMGNGWFRCTLSGTPFSGNRNPAVYGWNGTTRNFAGDTVSGWYVWGLQVENLPFASSYIATLATTASRSADSFTLAPAGGFNLTAETLFGWGADYAAANTGTIGLVALNDGAATNRIDFRLGTGTTGQSLASSGGTAEFTLAPTNQSAGGLNKCGVSASVATGGIAVINAGAAATAAMAAMPTALTTMDVGFVDAATANSIFGDVAAIGTWPVAATAAQLQGLTS